MNETTPKTKPKKIKWATYTVNPETPPVLKEYDLSPVTDIPIRLAVEQGYLKNKRDLSLYQLDRDWKGHPKDSIVIAGKLEEGREFAVWVADDKEHFIDQAKEQARQEEPATQAPSPKAAVPLVTQPQECQMEEEEERVTQSSPHTNDTLPVKIRVKRSSDLHFTPKRLHFSPHRPIGDRFLKKCTLTPINYAIKRR